MNILNIKSYLEKIDNNNPINLQKFNELVGELSLSHPFKPSDISARKVKGQQYQVIKINECLDKELRALANDIGSDRISSSRQNRSHNRKVDGSILLVRKYNSHPKVALFDKHGNYQGINQHSDRALLIENRQNFIDIDKTLSFLRRHACLCFEHPIDIIFGSSPVM